MIRMPKNEIIDKSGPETCNYSDDELIFEKLYLKCQTLETEKVKMLRVKENLKILNEKNENISDGLKKIKAEFDFYKSHLCKTLFNLKVSTDKQKILSRKKLDESLKKLQSSEEHYKGSPKKCELEKLLNENRQLQKELERWTDLLKVTKQQHVELIDFVIKTFQSKVCEFCDVVLRIKPVK